MKPRFRVDWIDGGREPLYPPNPLYPNGKDLDASGEATTACKVLLAYPAKRCGYYLIRCRDCGMSAVVTTAGRPDDPRSLVLACKGKRNT